MAARTSMPPNSSVSSWRASRSRRQLEPDVIGAGVATVTGDRRSRAQVGRRRAERRAASCRAERVGADEAPQRQYEA